MLPALPFALVAALGVLRMAIGPAWGILPLLAVGPALAAALSGPSLTLAVGAEALVLSVPFLVTGRLDPDAYHRALIACLAVVGVTLAASLASASRMRRDRALARVRLVAEAAQQVVMRPIPREAGPVKVAVRYLSAAEDARVGGDLVEVVNTPDCVRMVLGDAEGKGLPALQSAAMVLSVFREAAHEEKNLAAIVSRIETSLARQLGDEQFVTAVFAEISADGSAMDLLCCGHPAPLLLGPEGVRFAGFEQESLPLGLGDLTGEPRTTVTVAFGPGDQMLFYTDGIAEARDRAGEFFPLIDFVSLGSQLPPDLLLNRLCDEMTRHVGHAPDDDVALLLVYRDLPAGHTAGVDRPFTVRLPWSCSTSRTVNANEQAERVLVPPLTQRRCLKERMLSAVLIMVAFGLAAGVGITAVGPGGVLVTIGLFLASGLSPAQVAGTAIVTHLATGGLGSLAYHRSGQLRHPGTRRVALVLAVTAAAGTPVGVFVNAIAPSQLFGILLAVFLVAVALLVWFRSPRDPAGEAHPHHRLPLLICLGLGVAIVSGMFGVGGPLLTVPLLVLAGTPVLPALGAAQVQSVVVAGVGTLSYLSRGTIDWKLVLVVGIPELCGVLVGWKVARAVPAHVLKRALIVALLASACLVGIHG